MRKSLALKTLLRSPAKTILTFLLIAAASFALFSRITDYAIINRESAKAESFYYGVAALNNSTPPMGDIYFGEKPWPTEEQLAEFASLPGVTLADTRYKTDGLVEDYKRVIDPDSPLEEGEFVIEGTYDGFEEYDSGALYLLFHDITTYAGEIKFDEDRPFKIRGSSELDYAEYWSKPYSREFFEGIKKGSRCLILGTYSELSGGAFVLGTKNIYWDGQTDVLRVVDGLGDDYLETKEFAWYKGKIEATNQSTSSYDIVYTSDMRAIPYVNERRIVVAEGRPLTLGDTDACVVSELFLETYGLSVGDKLHIEFGDKLLPGIGNLGTRYREAENMSDFIVSAELEIIGAYRFTDEGLERFMDSNWSYGPATVFVPSSLLPVEVPEDYEALMGDFSVFIENPRDIEAFREEAEIWAADMDLGLRFSDGGWFSMRNNFETGSLASFLMTMLYVMGAALALLLAVNLYIGRTKNSYAIMRTLGVPSKKASGLLVLPFGILSVFAMVIGGLAGLFYASHTAAQTLADLSGSRAPEGYVYVLNAAIPAGAVIFCLILELLFIFALELFFLQKMKKTPPLQLLQEGAGSAGAGSKARILWNPYRNKKHMPDIADTSPIPDEFDVERISDVPGIFEGKTGAKERTHGKYNALQQVGAYILRHMRRGMGKTAVSLILTVALAAGIGMFVLAKHTYQEAYHGLDVKGRAISFSTSSIERLSDSDLLKDIYYYSNSNVRVNSVGVLSSITFTNDIDRYLPKDYTVTYAEGYDLSVFEGTGAVCLVGQTLAESMGIHPGDNITLMSEALYTFMPQVYEDEELEFAIERAGIVYKVVGILKSEEEAANAGIFADVNEGAESLFNSAPFPVGYCDFTLSDNRKLMELDSLLEEEKNDSIQYSPEASYHIDSDLLENTKRMRDLLVSLFPIAVAAAVLIGVFGPGLIIMQSAQEAAFLRILGVTKKRARCILVFEQIILCIIGIAVVAGVFLVFCSGQFMRSTQTLAFCWSLYFLGGLCGAFVAAAQVTRYKLLELLQVKE